MIAKDDIRTILEQTRQLGAPVLSLYLSTNPAREDSSPASIGMRAKSTLDALEDVPQVIKDRVLSRLSETPPRARTLAVFANADGDVFHELAVELPVHDPTTGRGDARWGEPYVTPLMVAVDENEHYGVVVVDSQHWRLLEVSLGAAEELDGGERALSPGEQDQLQQSKQEAPKYIADRGSGAKDQAQHHLDVLAKRFYADIGETVDSTLRDRGLSQLVVVGPDAEAKQFVSELPGPLQERVVAVLPSMPNTQASAGEIHTRLVPELVELRDKREATLLDDAAERGVYGLDACLHALQDGRLDTIAVPWGAGQVVYRDPETGYVGTTRDATRERSAANSDLVEVPLRDALPAVASTYGAKIEFVLGAARERLENELEGMAGLKRW